MHMIFDGASVSEQVTKNQHFVPRFYLDNFADSERFNYVFDKRYKSIRKKNNRFLCSDEHYYDLPTTLNPNQKSLFQVVEKGLSRVEEIGEQMISSVLKAVDSTDLVFGSEPIERRLTGNQIRGLSDYIAVQYLRTESARDLIRREHNAIACELAARAGEQIDPSFDATAFEWKVNENWIRWYHIDSISKFTNFTELFASKVFVIGVNLTGQELVTSDNPVVMLPHEKDEEPRMDSLGMRLLFPLSPKVVICMYEPKVWRQMHKWDAMPRVITEEEVEQFNDMQVLASRINVFSRCKSQLQRAAELVQQNPELFAFDSSDTPKSDAAARSRLVNSILAL